MFGIYLLIEGYSIVHSLNLNGKNRANSTIFNISMW